MIGWVRRLLGIASASTYERDLEVEDLGSSGEDTRLQKVSNLSICRLHMHLDEVVEIAQTWNFRCHDIESSESYVGNNMSSGFIDLEKVINYCCHVYNIRRRLYFNYDIEVHWNTYEVRSNCGNY